MDDFQAKSKKQRQAYLDGIKSLYGNVVANTLPQTKRKPKRTYNPLVPDEDYEQEVVCAWLDKHPWLLYHSIPNGGQRSRIAGAKLKRTGLKKGVPDLFFAEPRLDRNGKFWPGLYIEMKRRKGGQMSDYQKWWRAALKQRGYWVERCDGADQAFAAIREYFWDKEHLFASVC